MRDEEQPCSSSDDSDESPLLRTRSRTVAKEREQWYRERFAADEVTVNQIVVGYCWYSYNRVQRSITAPAAPRTEVQSITVA